MDLKACGNQNSTRVGFEGSTRFGLGDFISGVSNGTQKGTSKTGDVFVANVSSIDKGIMHPAMYPVSLCAQLIQTFTREGDTVLDPFTGSGSTLLAAEWTKRNYVGFELSQEYANIAQTRLTQDVKYYSSSADLEDLFE